MKFKIRLKDIVNLNKKIDEGKLVNLSSLEYALSIQDKNKNWLDHLAHFTRAILIDHPFEDGNKRTAAILITIYLETYNQHYNEDKVEQLIVRIIKQNIISIKIIRRLIQNVII